MIDYNLGEVEMKFAQIIWEYQPLSSGKLVDLCQEKLNWKKSTTYTVLRKLCQKGFFENENAVVTSLISENEYKSMQSQRFVKETFSGSLPQFLTAFTRKQKLSAKEKKEIQKLIDTYQEE